MSKNKLMNILLVEDDIEDCEMFRNYIDSREDLRLVATVNSFEDAINAVKEYLPEAIILDLELNDGRGSGLDILEEIKKMHLDVMPVIVITTNILSKRVYNYAHRNGADLIFHKLKEDYSAELVIKNILYLSQTIIKQRQFETKESPSDRKERISKRINRELDLIGISAHLIGRKYIHDAILYLIENDNEEDADSVFVYIAKLHKKGNSTIGRSIQTSIDYAWKRSSIEDLQRYYTATVNYNTGVPTPTELIYYYVDKIKREIL